MTIRLMPLLIFKKFIVFILLIGLFLPCSAWLFWPKPAKAIASGSTVFDIPTEIATAAHYLLSDWKTFADIFWNTVLKPMLLRKLTNDIVNWIQGGGKPRFVSDWQGFLTDTANEAGAVFLNELTGVNWCNVDWGITLQIALQRPPHFADQAKCTLTSILDNGGFTIEEFYEDFSKGGWEAWNALVEPENNFYGAYFKAWQAKTNEEEAAAEAAKNEYLAGGGFASDKECVSCAVMGENGQCQLCAKWVIKTPGSVIADAVSKTVTQDIDWLITADEWDEYIGAIINAVINRVLREGLDRMKTGSGSYTQSYYGTYEDTGDTTKPLAKITSPRDGTKLNDFDPIIITANASDNQKISKVEFYVDDKLICTDTSAPYTCEWTPPEDIMDKKSVNVVVMAYDSDGNVGFDRIGLFVDSPNDPPVADAGEDLYLRDDDGNGHEPFYLDGSNSYDLDGTITNYRWFVILWDEDKDGDGKPDEETFAFGPNVFKGDNSGVTGVGHYEFWLEVTDNDGGTDRDSVNVVIAPQGSNATSTP